MPNQLHTELSAQEAALAAPSPRHPAIRLSNMATHVVVVGAGITGVTTAYLLAQQGFRVSVLEGNRYPAMDTSFANGGQLSASNAEVWNSWSTIAKAFCWILKKDAPLLLSPKPNWHKVSWMTEFMWNIANYEKNTVATARLAIAARNELFEMAQQANIDFDHVKRGILHVYRNNQDYDHASRVNKLLQQAGLDRRPIANAEIYEIEPALREEFYGGFLTLSDSTGDIHKFTRGLAQACEREGVRFLFNRKVQSIRTTSSSVRLDLAVSSDDGSDLSSDVVEADCAVVCAGVDSRRLASLLGDRVNVYPVKGYSITIKLDGNSSRTAAPWVSLLDDSAKIVTSRLGEDRLRVAGTAEFADFNRDIRADRITPLIAWTRRMFPDVCTDDVVPWTGLRPMMPNMMPVVRASCRPRVFYNTGHGHLGWTLAAATARMTANLIARQTRLQS